METISAARSGALAAAAGRVIAALEARGGTGCARFVGGCVRDALLGREIGDVDLATTLPPEETLAALEAGGLRAAPTGIAHGTVTAIDRGRPFEITTLRRDVETDGRRAVVAYTRDWAEDAARRDFTLNALYLSPAGELFDPTGRGVADARAGRIIFVGDPQRRIREDYLRILRFFRFQAWFGRGAPDPEALSACALLAEGLETLSAERVSRELLRLLAADDPRPALRAMEVAGVLGRLLPEAVGLSRLEGLVAVDLEAVLAPDAELRLAACLPGDPPAVRAAARRLRLSRAQEERLAAAASREARIVSWLSPKEARRAIYRLGRDAFKDRVRLAWAEAAAAGRGGAFPQWRMLLAFADTWTPPELPLRGEQILAAGVPRGPLVAEARREVEDWWVDLDFPEDPLAVLERLKAVAEGLTA